MAARWVALAWQQQVACVVCCTHMQMIKRRRLLLLLSLLFLPLLQPAMDVYSMGVLLFVMLVGRKPWDAQRSHTLAYAVQPTREAPGLRDPVFGALSAPAKQLLAWMLCEDPSRRPSMQQVLGHSWVLQGGVNKVRASG